MANTIIMRIGSIIIPTNPDHLPLKRASKTVRTEIVSLGEIAIPTTPTLAEIQIESLLIRDEKQGIIPNQIVEEIKAWQASKKPKRFTVEDLSYGIDLYVLCESFDYDTKAGEQDDVYYKLSLTEFRPYGAVSLNIPVGG